MNGTFMFWCFTGILTSLIAIQIEEPPLKSLNDLQSKSNFKLLTFGGGSTDKRMRKWAEETENLKSYERSINAISGFTKEHFEEAKNPNVAIILEDFGIKTWLEKCNMSNIPYFLIYFPRKLFFFELRIPKVTVHKAKGHST